MDPCQRTHKEAEEHEMPPVEPLYTILAHHPREASDDVQLLDQVSVQRYNP